MDPIYRPLFIFGIRAIEFSIILDQIPNNQPSFWVPAGYSDRYPVSDRISNSVSGQIHHIDPFNHIVIEKINFFSTFEIYMKAM